jgi:Fe2+ transport system protein FeoA
MLTSSKMPLARAHAGAQVRVCTLTARNGQAQRLRELGLLEGKTLRVVTNSDPLICQVGECRLGVGHRLAHCIIVEPLTPEHALSA